MSKNINQENQNSRSNSSLLNVSEQRTSSSRQKWFTSQISDLPGPKKELVRNLGQEYKEENKEAARLA
eukprot:CAMPEP_0170542502 /NCGR_PEP_ID=MMETSP0211-20121228/1903_1 /TAXON_ID=311385 /ORGANISM="Pseudokeronopsis sp., Strain OXSARD2" /LENGTH=67 /DNA_ID=CAMNT_0010845573 /DNA_START=514 /DNA_END=717 /DNA_ORIENTATION=-